MSGRSKKPFFAGFLLVLAVGVVVGATVLDTPASGAISLNASDGPNATVDFVTQESSNFSNPFPNANTVEWNTTAGNISFTSNGRTQVYIKSDNITGTWTNVSQLEVDRAPLTIDPADKPAAVVGGDVEEFAYRDSMNVDDSVADFRYGGASGHTNVTVQNLPVSTQVAAIDADTNAVLGVTTTTAAGNASFDRLPNSDHTVELQTSDGGPVVDNSSASPTSIQRNEDVTLSIDVDDPDFPDDNVSVKFYVNGTLRDTKHTKSQSTVSTTLTLSDGNYEWNVTAEDEYGQKTFSDTFSFELKHYSPVFSDRSPKDGYKMQSKGITLKATVNDSDFAPGGDGDELNVSFEHKPPGGSWDVVDFTDPNITSNASLQTSLSGLVGGEHKWRIVANDSWGQSSVSAVWSFFVPAEVEIYDEQNPDTLVTNTDVELRFYVKGEERVYEQSTGTNGKLNMTGLPVDKNFVVITRADGWYNRSVFFTNIYQQQEMYILKKTSASPDSIAFALDDQTGAFPAGETVLQIKRPLRKDYNNSGTTTNRYQVISGDFFDAGGNLETQLLPDKRYRLVLRNGGETKVLGRYSPSGDATVPLRVSQVNTSLEDVEGLMYNMTLRNTSSGNHVRVQLTDPTESTEDIHVKIYPRGNESNPIHNTTYQGPIGNLTIREPISDANASNNTYLVEITAERNGTNITVTEAVGRNQNPQLQGMPWWLQQFFALFTIFVLAGLSSQVNAQIGAVVTAMGGGMFFYIGFLPAAVGGGVVVLAMLISGSYYLRTRARPV